MGESFKFQLIVKLRVLENMPCMVLYTNGFQQDNPRPLNDNMDGESNPVRVMSKRHPLHLECFVL